MQTKRDAGMGVVDLAAEYGMRPNSVTKALSGLSRTGMMLT
jgi:hypothetical protein